MASRHRSVSQLAYPVINAPADLIALIVTAGVVTKEVVRQHQVAGPAQHLGRRWQVDRRHTLARYDGLRTVLTEIRRRFPSLRQLRRAIPDPHRR